MLYGVSPTIVYGKRWLMEPPRKHCPLYSTRERRLEDAIQGLAHGIVGQALEKVSLGGVLDFRLYSLSSSLAHSLCSGGNNSSYQYFVDYYDGSGSSSDADFAVDTLTLGSTTSRPVPLPKSIIGCGHDNERFTNANGSGVVGLGRGAISLVSQLGSSIDGKFSYCLIPFTSHGNTTSKLNFGSNAVVSGSGAVSTPLVLGQDSYYYITLEAIRVGRKRIDLTGASESGT
ncbi:aspartic proteinase CDR1-like [Quercus robur]|uniref:aspartic proteinase CDR1-like n=1 Tax=Quercus robur TaxID=38942 RepID=UPI00216165C9|nr:aspartic proteinase CDR1-like [Quercus robur]